MKMDISVIVIFVVFVSGINIVMMVSSMCNVVIVLSGVVIVDVVVELF